MDSKKCSGVKKNVQEFKKYVHEFDKMLWLFLLGIQKSVESGLATLSSITVNQDTYYYSQVNQTKATIRIFGISKYLFLIH
jgi:hypothetical protein